MSSGRRATREWTLPWGAWAEDGTLALRFPPRWEVHWMEPRWPPALPEPRLRAALEEPLGTVPLRELALRPGTVAVAVEDLSRPAGLEPVLSPMLSILQEAGKAREEILVIVAAGAHGRPALEEIERKVGPAVLAAARVVCHDPEAEDLAAVAAGSGRAVRIHRGFARAGVKVVVGSVLPHLYAGYSGGAKMVLPGLAALDDIVSTHKAVLMGLCGRPRQVEGNRFRNLIEAVARAAGVDFAVCLVVNGRREITGLHPGDVVRAHRSAVAQAEEMYALELPRDLDVAVLNAYPKDAELVQADNALIPLRLCPDLVKPRGTVVVTAAASRGLGTHRVFGPGGLLYRLRGKPPFLGERELVFLAPGVSAPEFHTLYDMACVHAARWEEVLDHLERRHGPRAAAGVVPCAPLTVPFGKGGWSRARA